MTHLPNGTPQRPPARRLTIAGAVCAVIGLLVYPLLALVGAALGFVAYSRGDRPYGRYVGIAGVVCFLVPIVLNGLVTSSGKG